MFPNQLHSHNVSECKLKMPEGMLGLFGECEMALIPLPSQTRLVHSDCGNQQSNTASCESTGKSPLGCFFPGENVLLYSIRVSF